MPPGFEWSTCNLSDPVILDEVYDLLYKHYVEDKDHTLRFNYSQEFLKWALNPPGFIPDWIIGVRGSTGKKSLFGFIAGIPVTTRAHNKEFKAAEINFLCVHKKLRSKRLAPVLIREVTRRINLTDCWQALYTAGTELPTPVSNIRYHHRLLNPKKLVECQFTSRPPNMTAATHIKLHRTKNELELDMRPMVAQDVPRVADLLNKYLNKFKLTVHFSEEDVAHWLLPRDGVVSTYCKVSKNSKQVTDFCSFYSLPSTLLKNELHNELRAAYHFYSVATTVTYEQLISEALLLAKLENFDVYNALALMENPSVFENLKFGPGDGYLHFYLYNWQCPQIEDHDVGVIML